MIWNKRVSDYKDLDSFQLLRNVYFSSDAMLKHPMFKELLVGNLTILS